MIDMHTHILPNVDDGAVNLEQTKTLMKEAKEAGFEGIVLTSHYLEGQYEKSVQEREEILIEIQKLEEIPLYIGNEIYLSENIVKLLKEGKATSIAHSRYVLFELPFYTKPMNLYEVTYELLQNKFVPILAHPERYAFVGLQPEMLYELIQKGVLMQCNYGSIIGQYGKKAQIIIKKLLQNNMVHFLGTDVHRPNSIYLQMPAIIEKLKELIGEEKLEELSRINPEKVLQNESINILEPKEWKYTLKEKWIMKQK